MGALDRHQGECAIPEGGDWKGEWLDWNDIHWPEPQPVLKDGVPFVGNVHELAALVAAWPETSVRTVSTDLVYAITQGTERTFRPKS